MARECASCGAFDPAGMTSHGYCRRRAPVVDQSTGDAAWPLVGCGDWCLEHVPKNTSQRLVQRPQKD